MSAPYIFHAFDVSYFSAKVRPALRYKRLWVDEVRAELRSSPVARFTGACASWLVQRVLGDYRALDTTDCKQVDEAVAGTGWEAVLAYQPRYRIENRGFDLVLAND